MTEVGEGSNQAPVGLPLTGATACGSDQSRRALLDGDRLVLTLDEVAGLLEMSRSAAYRAAALGEIPSRRVGRRLVVPVPLLRQWLGMDFEVGESPTDLPPIVELRDVP